MRKLWHTEGKYCTWPKVIGLTSEEPRFEPKRLRRSWSGKGEQDIKETKVKLINQQVAEYTYMLKIELKHFKECFLLRRKIWRTMGMKKGTAISHFLLFGTLNFLNCIICTTFFKIHLWKKTCPQKLNSVHSVITELWVLDNQLGPLISYVITRLMLYHPYSSSLSIKES